MKKYLLTRTSIVFTVFLALISLDFFPGCMYYYKVQTVDKVTSTDLSGYKSLNKYLILHQGESAWHLSYPFISGDMLSGVLSTLPTYRRKYLTTNPAGGNRYINTKKHYEGYVLDEVHLYVVDSLVPKLFTNDHLQVALSAIQKAEVYQKAEGRTTASWVLGAGAPILVLGGIIGIIAATKSSCPFVYIKNGQDFTFAGEIFGGAVYSSLERHDYMPLPGFHPLNGEYTLKITNGLPEIQYINLAELWVVNHTADAEVLPDRQGTVHTISKPEPPREAFSLAHADLLPLVEKKDQQYFLFDEEPSVTGDTCAFNTVFLSFTIPELADTGKLLITAGNSIWGDYTYGEFTKLFGHKYGAWIKKQGREPAAKNIQWLKDQRFCLMVYVETKSGWQFVDYFDMIGPLGTRDLIMPVDLSNALITNTPDHDRVIRIKLESGFKFWDLDYTAMDFSKDEDFTINRLKPYTAITESGKDVAQSLSQNDSHYYIQETTGEEGLVIFRDNPGQDGFKKSVFLHTKGYYEHVRDYTNHPDKKQLQTFLIPGRFSKFSYDNHIEFTTNNWVFAGDPDLP